ncbi:4-diphosphocytidyl-2C-methyl-D-erythritol kinase [Georgfuchsia toluolica]|uniref:4-diphosphocytidyl-2C-methyl-D-erythritol kinase n=1 Tax=Georgfuchsia toluolica TaxID=424218 RepID=A0A916N074_9PROT|nr:molybdopterin-binding/glycosyltransferase family 2 protein [Georgfuchsia toluolica]CAG4883628.1 4-diphosphocytidyl-2C-methyl-D-erythritol kinase [Georgfuchsia toluolica]
MIFGAFPCAEAEGVRLAHTLKLPQLKLRKGHVLSAIDVAALEAAGITSVSGARLAPGEIGEDDAARAIAALLATTGIVARPPYTGRCNLYAQTPAVLCIDAERIDRLNRITEAITLATAPQHACVRKNQRIATVKIIPFAVAPQRIDAWRKLIGTEPPLRLAPLRACRAALIMSVSSATTDRMLDIAVDITRDRLETLGGKLALELRCNHDSVAVSQALRQALAAGCDLLLVLGATVSKDRGDVVPTAISISGGVIEHFGMPVEPGNMLLTARIGGVPVLNLPGCARSRSQNGFDLVLQRLLAGLPLAPHDIMGLGVGGLMHRVSEDEAIAAEEPAAIAPTPRSPRIAALVLAAGRSTRMGEHNKLLCNVSGVPLALRVTNAACASHVCQVMVVTGHESERVEAALAGRPVSFTHNPDYAQGLSTSLRRGLRALPADIDAVIVLLADMPGISAGDIDRLLDYFDLAHPCILVPEHEGRRGNPVVWPRRYFGEMADLSGDTGARGLLEQYANDVRSVAIASPAIFADIDTPEALAAYTDQKQK